jgi:tetratricopeptide (TPR) repeat protein
VVTRIHIKTLLCTASILLASCAALPKNAVPVPERSVAEQSLSKANGHLEQGEYPEALALYASTYERNREREFLATYLQAGNRIKSAGDRAYQMRDFPRAGIIYSLLLESRICVDDLGKALSFDDVYLRKQISACSKALTEAGLKKYRQDKLEDAIALWEQVLAFDPDNTKVKNAVDTANRQLRKLKVMQ